MSETALKRSGTSHTEIYEQLKSAIRSGEIHPGTRLKEVTVANTLGVSRTTLRQALWRLHAEDFVDFESRAGFSARRLDNDALYDLVEMTLLVVLSGAEAAIASASDSDRSAFVSEWTSATPDMERFELALVSLSGNQEIPELLRRLQALCYSARSTIMGQAEFDINRQILEAVEMRDRSMVQKALYSHFQNSFGLNLEEREVPVRQPTPSIPQSSVIDRVYQQVHNKLIDFEVRPGERLKEEELARETLSSRLSVREALSRLVAEKLVAWEANRGFSVRALKAKEIYDLCELRGTLEAQMVMLAIKRGRTDELSEFDTIWRDVYDRLPAMDGIQIIREDEAFHERLVVLTGNQTLKRELDSIAARIHFIRGIDLKQSRANWANEHTQISKAVAAHDGPTASKMMQAHLQRLFGDIHVALKIGVEQLYID